MLATTTIDVSELKRFIDEHISEIHTNEDLSRLIGYLRSFAEARSHRRITELFRTEVFP